MEGEEEQEEHFFLVLVLVLAGFWDSSYWCSLLAVMGRQRDSCWILISYSASAIIALNAFPIQDFLEGVSEFQIMNIIMISGDSQAPQQTKNRSSGSSGGIIFLMIWAKCLNLESDSWTHDFHMVNNLGVLNCFVNQGKKPEFRKQSGFYKHYMVNN